MGFRQRETQIMRDIKGIKEETERLGIKGEIKGEKKVTPPESPAKVDPSGSTDIDSDMGTTAVVPPDAPPLAYSSRLLDLADEIKSRKPPQYGAIPPKMQPFLDQITGAQTTLADDLVRIDGALAKAKEEAKAGRASKEERLQWAELGEKAAQALTQFAAGWYGLQKGVDMSGLKFNPTDWSAKFKDARQDYLDELSDLAEKYGYDVKAAKEAKDTKVDTARLGMGLESDRVGEERRVQGENIRAAERQQGQVDALRVKDIELRQQADRDAADRALKLHLAGVSDAVAKAKQNDDIRKRLEKAKTKLSGITTAVGDRPAIWKGKGGDKYRRAFGESMMEIASALGISTPDQLATVLVSAGVPPRDVGSLWWKTKEPLTAEALASADHEMFTQVAPFLMRLASGESASPKGDNTDPIVQQERKDLTSPKESDTVKPGTGRKILPSAADLP